MSAAVVAPGEAAGHLVEMSADVRAAVLIDPAGGLVGAGGLEERAVARRVAALAHDLLGAADAAGQPTELIEAHTGDGGVFAVRNARFTLACVARRVALPALVLYDMRQTLMALEDVA